MTSSLETKFQIEKRIGFYLTLSDLKVPKVHCYFLGFWIVPFGSTFSQFLHFVDNLWQIYQVLDKSQNLPKKCQKFKIWKNCQKLWKLSKICKIYVFQILAFFCIIRTILANFDNFSEFLIFGNFWSILQFVQN